MELYAFPCGNKSSFPILACEFCWIQIYSSDEIGVLMSSLLKIDHAPFPLVAQRTKATKTV